MIARTLSYAAVVVMAMTSTAQAQSSVADAVFSEIEKRVIRDYYGVGANGQTTDDGTVPEWAVKDQGDQNDDQDSEDRGEKNKGDKNKGEKNKDKKDKSKGLPPGLAKRDQLPPGLAKQLKEKGRLPAGLAKRDLPADLASQLPSRPADQDVTVVDNDVVLVDKATGIILDVLKDVVTNGSGPSGGDTSMPSNGTMAAPPTQNAPAQGSWIGGVMKSIFGSGN